MPHGSKTMLSSIFFHLFVYGLFWAVILLANLPVPAMFFSRRSFQPPASWGWSLHHESSSNCRSCSQGNQKAWLHMVTWWLKRCPIAVFFRPPTMHFGDKMQAAVHNSSRYLLTFSSDTEWVWRTKCGKVGFNDCRWKSATVLSWELNFIFFIQPTKGSNDWLYIMMVSWWFQWLNWTLPDPLKKSVAVSGGHSHPILQQLGTLPSPRGWWSVWQHHMMSVSHSVIWFSRKTVERTWKNNGWTTYITCHLFVSSTSELFWSWAIMNFDSEQCGDTMNSPYSCWGISPNKPLGWIWGSEGHTMHCSLWSIGLGQENEWMDVLVNTCYTM